jgi:hypothetical protein
VPELLLDEELVELVVELELLLEEAVVVLEDAAVVLEEELELLELEDELEEELLLEVPPLPVQVGATKLLSCVPRKPKTLVKVWPGAGNCQPYSLLNWSVVPQLGLARIAFQSLVQQTDSGQFTDTVQPLKAVVPVLVTLTSTWKVPPPVLEGVAVQLYAANAGPFNSGPSIRPDNSTPNFMVFILIPPPHYGISFHCLQSPAIDMLSHGAHRNASPHNKGVRIIKLRGKK